MLLQGERRRQMHRVETPERVLKGQHPGEPRQSVVHLEPGERAPISVERAYDYPVIALT